MNILENRKQIIESAMNCKEYSSNNCEGCPYLKGDYYTGDRTDKCFDYLMDDTSTDDKAEMIIQAYLLGAKEQIERNDI